MSIELTPDNRRRSRNGVTCSRRDILFAVFHVVTAIFLVHIYTKMASITTSVVDHGAPGEEGGEAGKGQYVLRSVDLWIKGSVKSRAFLLRRDASSPPPSGASHGLFYPEIPPPQYVLPKIHESSNLIT